MSDSAGARELDPLRLRAQLDATERRLRATHAVSRVLADESSLDSAAPRLLEALGTALGCELATLWVPEGDVLVCRAAWSQDPALPWHAESRALRFRRGEGLPGRVWSERGAVWIAALDQDDLPRQHLLEQIGIHSAIGFPIMAGPELVAVLDLFTQRAQEPDDQLVEVLRAVGGHLGHYMRAVAVREELRREVAQSQATALELELERATLAKLNEIGLRIAGELDVQALVQAVSDAATELTGAELGAFFYTVPDHEGEIRTRFAVSGIAREVFGRIPLPRPTSLLGPVLAGRQIVRIDDLHQDPRYGKTPPYHGPPPGHPPVRSYLAVPVHGRDGRNLGCLMFGHARPAAFGERSQRLAVALAAQAGTAMDNARLFGDAQRLIRELEKTNAELDQFAYAASHDLRAPLRGITNLATWIEEDLGAAASTSVRKHVEMLKGRAARMDRLINGLLELARVGRTHQPAERVDITSLIDDVVELLAPPEAARVLIIGAMPTIVAERAALQQVFLNLIGNALQHSGRPDVLVRISARDHAEHVELAIADNGVGIPREHHERVWQMFQTLASRDVVESTGIGLSIVKKQVEANGGTAWIDPAAMPGATLRFTWPKRPPHDG